MPDATRQWLTGYVRDGGKMIAVDRLPDGDWPSLRAGTRGRSAARRCARRCRRIVTLTPAVGEIGFVHRDLGDAQVYFLANTSNRSHQVTARFRSATAVRRALGSDDRGDRARRGTFGRGRARLRCLRVAHRRIPRARSRAPLRTTRTALAAAELRSPWSITFLSRGAASNEPGRGSSGVGIGMGDASLPYSWADSC